MISRQGHVKNVNGQQIVGRMFGVLDIIYTDRQTDRQTDSILNTMKERSDGSSRTNGERGGPPLRVYTVLIYNNNTNLINMNTN